MRAFCLLFILFPSFELLSQITVDFNSDVNSACEQLSVNYQDLSSSVQGSIVKWNWDLSISNSSEQNPGTIYNQAGEYTICLEVEDTTGAKASLCKPNFIKIFANPQADFEVDTISGCAPLKVNFSDQSLSAIDLKKWTWNIGGSTGSIITENPDELICSEYQNAGTYTASLSVEDLNGCTNTINKSGLIEVFAIPEFEISLIPKSTCGFPKIYDLEVNDPSSEVDYQWILSNGDVYNGPVINDLLIASPQNLDVEVIASSAECTYHLVEEDFIQTDGQNFSIIYENEKVCVDQEIILNIDPSDKVDSIKWQFGDGSSADIIEPVHSYNTVGCYPIMALVYYDNCLDTIYSDQCIEVLGVPEGIATQVLLDQECNLPASLNLWADNSIDGSFQWFIQGPNLDTTYFSSTVQFYLTSFGQYDIRLKFINEAGCVFNKFLDPIRVEDFSISMSPDFIGGCIPLEVLPHQNILDNDGAIDYQWNIGNGLFTSFDKNPSFTIQDTGEYDLKLVVTNQKGCKDSIFIPRYVQAGIPPITDFEAFPREDCASKRDTFLDLSSFYADAWIWDFGDGDTSHIQNPTHLYNDSIYFTVSLTAFHNGCPSKETKDDYIHPIAPISLFNVHYNCEDPYSVEIGDFSIGADSRRWIVNYGSYRDTIYTVDTLSLTFPERGDFSITLLTENFDTGCDFIRFQPIEIRDPEPNFSLDQSQGCVPLELNFEDFSIDAINYRYFFEAELQNDTFPTPSSLITIPGAYAPPRLEITDMHGCTEEYVYPDSIYVNKLTAGAEFRTKICLPDTLGFNDRSQSLFTDITNWQWKLNDEVKTVQNPIFSLEEIMVYDLGLVIEDEWGCMDSLYIPDALDVIDPIVEFTSDTLSCTWAEISFQNLSDEPFIISYEWDFGDGNFSNQRTPTHLYDNEGDYTVCLSIESINGCQKTICKDHWISIKDPKADFALDNNVVNCPPLIANFENTSVNATISLWDFGDDSGISDLQNPLHIYNEPGSYDIELIAISTFNCIDTLVLEDYIQVGGPIGTLSMTNDSSCLPLKVELIAELQDFYGIEWDFDNGVTQVESGTFETDTVTYVYNHTGSYTPRMILIDNTGCQISYSGEEVNVHDIYLDFDAGDQILCFDEEAELSIKNYSLSTSPNISFEWFVPNSIEQFSTELDPSFHLNEMGAVEIQMIAKAENCVDTLIDEAALELITKVEIEAIGDTVCYGERGLIQSFGNADRNQWQGVNFNFEQDELEQVNIQADSSLLFRVIGLRENCESDTAFAELKVWDKIEIDLVEDYQAYANVDIQVDLEYDATKPYEFEWSPPENLSCDDCPDPWIENIQSPMQFMLTVTDTESNCEIEELITVRYQNKCSEKAFYLPNVFTPNKDGSNDGFRIFAQEEEEFIELYIFDRWGEEMFYTDEIDQMWDGYFKSEPLQPGVYAVSIKAICLSSQEEYFINHTVAIVR